MSLVNNPFSGAPNETAGGSEGWGNQRQPKPVYQHQPPPQENPVIVVATFLADEENNDDKNLNSDAGFMASVEHFNQNGQRLSVGEFTQHLVENGCPEDWLLRICNRARRNREGRVVLHYGNGFQTTVIFAQADNERTEHLSVGLMAQAHNVTLPMLPTDAVWAHVLHTQQIRIKTGGVLWQGLPPESGRIIRVWPRAGSPHILERMEVVSSSQVVARMPPPEEEEEARQTTTNRHKAEGDDKKPATNTEDASTGYTLFGFSRGEQNLLYDAWCDDWRKPAAKKRKTAAKKKASASEGENSIKPNPDVEDETPAAVKPAAKKKMPSKKKAPAAEESEPAAMAAKPVEEKEAASKEESPVALVDPEEEKTALAIKPAAKRKASTSKKAVDAECVARMPPPEAEVDASEMEGGSKKPSEWTVFGFTRDEQNQLFGVWCDDWFNPTTKRRKAAAKTKALATSMENKVGEEKDDEAPAPAKESDPDGQGEAEEAQQLGNNTSLEKNAPATARKTEAGNEEEGEVPAAVKPTVTRKTSSKKKAPAAAKGS